MVKRQRRRPTRLGVETLESRHLLAGMVINEIHFDPDDSTEKVEFIELHNAGPAVVDLSGWVLDDAVDYLFPQGAQLAAGDYYVVAQDAGYFSAKFGFAPDGQWQTGDKLSNDGENIQLRNGLGQVVDEVDYRLGFPWPTVGEDGRSIELIHPDLDNNLAGSWRSSVSDLPTQPVTLLAAQASNWRYRKGTSEASQPIDAWRQANFVEDSSWLTGRTSIGYGDGDDNTILSDMRNSYTSVYLRNTFTIVEPVPNLLELSIYVDDGAVVWINGARVGLFHVDDRELAFNDTAYNHDAEWETVLVPDATSFLRAGVNTIAIHALNTQPNSSDFSIDASLRIPGSDQTGEPTAGARNSVYSPQAPPQLRQLRQSVQQPAAGQEVVISIKATDPDGVQSVTLDYQLVNPGNYIRLTDPAYETSWTNLAMNDDGLDGDEVAGDAIFSATLPGSVQTHRRLVRYRITALDNLGTAVTAPYADDPQPNFAYFVYDGAPDYTGSLRPGVQPNITYSSDSLGRIDSYFLIANSQDIDNSQYNGTYNRVQFRGTFVYDGIVYDHVEFRNRGQASTYQVGKNKWKLNFLRGHAFQARDNYGQRYAVDWDKLNILPGTNPWWRNDISTEGTVLFEPVAFRLYELGGTPSSHTQFFHFYVVDGAQEVVSGNQYEGDFWGLYIGIEQPDGRFLQERDLPDGNLFNMHSSVFGATTQRNQGSDLPTDRSDLSDFVWGLGGGYQSLASWQQNLNFGSYFAWNIINHAVNNSDIRANENVNYYHNQESGLWYIIPWDLDLTFEDAPHWNQTVTQRDHIRRLMLDNPAAALAYRNQLRETVDLLLDNGDAARVVEEYAYLLTDGGTDASIIDANIAQWDYHPRKRKPGIWYANFNSALLPDRNFDSLVSYMQTYLSPGGYGYQLLQTQGSDSGIPLRPELTYVGEPDYPRDRLSFQTSAFSDPQGAATFAAMEWRIAEVHHAGVANYDPSKPYRYELEGAWSTEPLPQFASEFQFPETLIDAGRTYRVRVRMQDASGNWSHWSEAVEFQATPATGPRASDIVISEINYHPYPPTPAELAAVPGVDKEKFEFIEIWNTHPSAAIDLSGFTLSEGASFSFGQHMLGPGARAVVVENTAAFTARYGTGPTVLGQWSGGLSNAGERLVLSDGRGQMLLDFAYGDARPWPELADGAGASLELVGPDATPADELGKYYHWQASPAWGGTPGAENLLAPQVVLNELAVRTEAPDVDAIELLNLGDQPVDIGGWYLSDTASELLKFRIPDGTVLEPHGYRLFDEHDFNPQPDDPAPHHFALNGTEGESVFLVVPDGQGGVSLLVDGVRFDAAVAGEAWGRYPDGSGMLQPMLRTTLGGENNYPRVGPLLITEVNYHPSDPLPETLAVDPTLTDNDLEFLEIYNPTAESVMMTGWQIRGEAELDFPDGLILGPGQALLIVRFDPEDPAQATRKLAFMTQYQMRQAVAMVGPFSGALNNGFGRVVLQRPDAPLPGDPTLIPLLAEDQLIYDDRTPWPAAADGEGATLQRVGRQAVGQDASSWRGAVASPGAVNLALEGDLNYDGFLDETDIDSLVAAVPAVNGSLQYDLNGDRLLDAADIALWLAFAGESNLGPGHSYLVGDANLDGVVDTSDFNIWNTNKFSQTARWTQGDFNADGVTDASDFNLWNGNRFRSAAVAIPAGVQPMTVPLSLPAFNAPLAAEREPQRVRRAHRSPAAREWDCEIVDFLLAGHRDVLDGSRIQSAARSAAMGGRA